MGCSDYRDVNIIVLLRITPSVVIITGWLKMEVSYLRVGICYGSPRHTTRYCTFLSPRLA